MKPKELHDDFYTEFGEALERSHVLLGSGLNELVLYFPNRKTDKEFPFQGNQYGDIKVSRMVAKPRPAKKTKKEK